MNSGSEAESFSFEVSQRGRDKEVLYRLGGRQLRSHLERGQLTVSEDAGGTS